MIRLNDKDNARINEKNIDYYIASDTYNSFAIEINVGNELYDFCYETKEARDKDIELLDKLLDVKSIEDKVEKQGEENHLLQKCEPEKEKYLTWEEVKHNLSLIKAEMPNGATKMLHYNEKADTIIIKDIYTTKKEACIYEGKLFNALKLKRVE